MKSLLALSGPCHAANNSSYVRKYSECIYSKNFSSAIKPICTLTSISFFFNFCKNFIHCFILTNNASAYFCSSSYTETDTKSSPKRLKISMSAFFRKDRAKTDWPFFSDKFASAPLKRIWEMSICTIPLKFILRPYLPSFKRTHHISDLISGEALIFCPSYKDFQGITVELSVLFIFILRIITAFFLFSYLFLKLFLQFFVIYKAS